MLTARQTFGTVALALAAVLCGVGEAHAEVADFNGDGQPDLLWQHRTTGQLAVWYMDGVTRVGGAALVPSPIADLNWQVVGVADFNGDGQPDLLWRHQTTGQLAVWYMDGVTRVGGAALVPSPIADLNWQVAGVADFNGDGQPDLLWRHQTTGQLAVWYMDGVTRVGGAALVPSPIADLNWQVVGVADFNGDGQPDLLWRHQTTGQLAVWYMDGVTRVGGAALVPSPIADLNWQVAGVADFNGDGQPDLLWRHQTTGQLAVWYMDGVTRVGGAALVPSPIADLNWQIMSPYDTTPPVVTGVSPAGGATGVATTTVVKATFSEAMTATTISGTTVRLQAGASAVPATVAYNATTRTATLTPSAALVPATTYTATVLGGASGVKDLAGHALATTFTWTFTTPSLGHWSPVLSWPLVAINATLLRTGQVLMWDGGTSVGDPPTHGGLSAQLWNPQTQTFTPVPTSRTDLFCSSSCALPDGRIFVAGGSDPTNNSVGISHANVFDPGTGVWSSAPSMAYRRWYPTATCLPDGRVLVASGSQFSDYDWVFVPEVYNPGSNTWTQLSNAAAAVPYYPHSFVLPDGRVLNASTFQQPYASDILNVQNQTRTLVDNLLLDGGSAVMYLPGKILKSGTATFNSGSTQASGTAAYVLDMTAPVPTWRQTNSMGYPRSYHTLTVLPNGTVLVTGGGRIKNSTDVANAVYEAEVWSPQTEAWTTVSRMQRPRLYHSTALLLPDGRVLVAGGGRNFRSNLKELNAEIYSPPYLFNGPRPTITAIPSSVTYGRQPDRADTKRRHDNLGRSRPARIDDTWLQPGSTVHSADVPAVHRCAHGSSSGQCQSGPAGVLHAVHSQLSRGTVGGILYPGRTMTDAFPGLLAKALQHFR